MSLLHDLYRNEEIAENDDIEQVIEQDGDNDDNNSHSEAEEEAPKVIKPPKEKKAVLKPRLTLNPKRLTGPRGIQVIEDIFKNFQFKGKGHEKEDLDAVMKNLEYWAHRLYPKFKFDDCLDKIATLGKKKEVSNHVQKIRLNQLCDDVAVERSDNEDNTENNADDICFDEFDRLLNQQIELAKSTPMGNAIKTPSSDMFNNSAAAQRSEKKVEMSSEQRERMLLNRLKAEQKRLERLNTKENENARLNQSQSVVEPDSDVITSNNDIVMAEEGTD